MKKNYLTLILFALYFILINNKTQAQLPHQYKMYFKVHQIWSNYNNTTKVVKFEVQNEIGRGVNCIIPTTTSSGNITLDRDYNVNGWTTTSTSFHYGFDAWTHNASHPPCNYGGTATNRCTDWNIFQTSDFTTYTDHTWHTLGWRHNSGENSCSNGKFDLNVQFKYERIYPGIWGNTKWNIYAFDGNNVDNLNLIKYRGFYTRNTLGVNTYDDYGSTGSPSSVNGTSTPTSGWNGGNVPTDYHTVVAKRKGFDCGIYRLKIARHDDAVRLLINDIQQFTSDVWYGGGSSYSYPHTAYTGFLDTNSTIEVRYGEATGGAGVDFTLEKITHTTLQAGNIAGSSTICSGEAPNTLTSTSAGFGGVSAYTNGGSITYQWQQSTNGGTTWSNISGATALTYAPPALTQTTHFRRIASDKCNTSANSNVVVVTVSPLPVGGTTASDQILCYGSSANAITLSGHTGSIVRWEIDDNSAFSTPANITNATTTLTGAEIDDKIGASNSVALYVRAVVNNTGCTETTSATSIVRYNLPDNLIMGDASGSCISNSINNWVNIYDPSSHRLIASIRDNNQNLGAVSAQVYYNGGNSFNITPSSGSCGSHAVMNRSYVINSSNTFTNPVNVRLYFTDAELNSLISNAGCNDPNGCQDDDDVCNINDLFVTQISGAASEDGTFDATDGTFTLHTPTNSGVGNNHFGANYVQFSVSSFSEFWIHGSEHSVPLPVEMTYFTAKSVENQKIRLDWQTATEINNEGFAIERSKDGKNFVQVGYVKGNGNNNEMNNYQYEDRNVIAGTYYYRLKQIDFDGKFEYSDIKSATIDGFQGIALSNFIPNPAQHKTKLEVNLIEQSNVAIQIFDNLGKLVTRKNYSLEAGVQKLHFNLNNYTQGVYAAKIRVNNENYVRKLIVE